MFTTQQNIFSNLQEKILSNETQINADMDVELPLPMPGKGKKFLFYYMIKDRKVEVIIDAGSSTTLVRKSLVSDLNLNYYTSRLPVNFLGMFGAKMVPDAKIASVVNFPVKRTRKDQTKTFMLQTSFLTTHSHPQNVSLLHHYII